MRAKVIKFIEQKGSSNGAQKCYILCFKAEDGKSYRTWTDDHLGNFKRWYNVILGFITCEKLNEELWLDGLVEKGKGIIDADSVFKMEKQPKPLEMFIPNHSAAIKPEVNRKDLL